METCDVPIQLYQVISAEYVYVSVYALVYVDGILYAYAHVCGYVCVYVCVLPSRTGPTRRPGRLETVSLDAAGTNLRVNPSSVRLIRTTVGDPPLRTPRRPVGAQHSFRREWVAARPSAGMRGCRGAPTRRSA